MTQGNDVVSSRSFTEEATNTQRQRLASGTLTYTPPELPTLPEDLLPEILCRLPVKLLVQLRCVCKFFNSLISDPKFAKKHLQLSTKRHHLMLTKNDDELVMYDSSINSLFSTSTTVVPQTLLYLPSTLTDSHRTFYLSYHGDVRYSYHVNLQCSCDGIFCGTLKPGSYFLWNPSIRKFKLLPPFGEHCFSISFGYDHFIDNYKVIVVSSKNKVFVYTLGTDYWTRIQDIPYSYRICGDGVFVSGTVNWLAFDDSHILSLDLENESYQKLCPPDFGDENNLWDFGVLRDCLCVFASSDEYWDVWIMKEYGNQESWTKLYTIPNLQDQDLEGSRALYISEDDQLLVECYELQTDDMELVVYDPKSGISNIPEFQNNYEHTNAKVYIESLISP